MTDEHRLARTAETSDELVSPADAAAFQDAFLRLIERRTALYTMGDSTSLPTYVAADLLRSICFVLGIDLEDGEVPGYLLGVDLEEEFARRHADIARRVEEGEALWREVCVAMPPIPNIALRDTLVEILGFFENYDYRFMAHDIPCSIDYPLCEPVETSLQGIDYIAEYLRRLMIEARFIGLFEVGACERVLASASPDYVGLLVNLYEPVATNAIGLALLGQDPLSLVIRDVERQATAAFLGPLSDSERERVLQQAADDACDALGMSDGDGREYLRDIVPELLPRIEVGLEHGGLDGIFVG